MDGGRRLWSSDHPRSRGVYGWGVTHRIARSGSSPLARGLRVGAVALALVAGIIPARAGFTQCPDLLLRRHGDHPRSRGVYPPRPDGPAATRGSSPLARGLQLDPVVGDPAARIIPARAGFTRRGPARGGGRADHPRSRGVYRISHRADDHLAGSSPLARGLPPPSTTSTSSARIIPARAGFTPPRDSRGEVGGDHPRSRGVYKGSRRRRASSAGSSPLARGLRNGLAERVILEGIIPARAGFTGGDLRGLPLPPDHPRSRGVYTARSSTRPGPPGSSPLARGLPDSRGCRHPHLGIIPARAGFTGMTRSPRPMTVGIIPARAGFTECVHLHGDASSDHPRSRGVYTERAPA